MTLTLSRSLFKFKQQVASIKASSLNESACVVNDRASYNLTIRASTTLVQKVAGNVVDGLCVTTVPGCWDGTRAIAGATVTATIPSSSSGSMTCQDSVSIPPSDASGQYLLSIPYRSIEHGATAALTYAADGFQPGSGSVELGASTLTPDTSRCLSMLISI